MKTLIFTFVLIFIAIVKLSSQTVTTISNTGSGINDDIIYMEDGSIIGTDHAGDSIYKLLPDGTLQTIVSGVTAPNGLEKDTEGNIYIGAPQKNKIYKLSSNGTLSEYISNILNPNNLMFQNNSDTLLMASYVYSKIYKIAPDRTIITIFDGAPLNGPLGMTYDANDDLYIANFTDGKVFRVNGTTLELFATVPGATVTGLQAAIGYIKFINGYFYATGFGKNKIYRITQSGVVEEFAGSGLAGTLDGDASTARFYWPNGIDCNPAGDTLYISEYYSHAVRMITDFVTTVEEETKSIPQDFQIEQNYPNPFNPTTNIRLILSKQGFVHLSIYDTQGQEVAILVNEQLSAGDYNYVFDAKGLTSGVYLIRLSVSNNIFATKKMMLLK